MGYTHFSGVDATNLKINGTQVTSSAAELNVLDGVSAGTVAASKAVVVDSNKDIGSFRNVTFTGSLINGSGTVSAAELNMLDGMIGGVTYTIGSEVNGGTITVNCQFTDANGDDMATAGALMMYVSDVASGLDYATTPPDGGIDNGTDGDIIEFVANTAWLGISEADGDLDIVLQESGDKSFYLVAVLPDGSLDVSGEINFD